MKLLKVVAFSVIFVLPTTVFCKEKKRSKNKPVQEEIVIEQVQDTLPEQEITPEAEQLNIAESNTQPVSEQNEILSENTEMQTVQVASEDNDTVQETSAGDKKSSSKSSKKTKISRREKKASEAEIYAESRYDLSNKDADLDQLIKSGDQENSEDMIEEISALPTVPRKELEIWGADHPMAVKYREKFLTGQNKKWLIEALERSVMYRPYIIEQLQEKGLPLLLQYLPIVESYYNVYAVSYAGATGIWQFMTNSMGSKLSKNTWYDERRDPWKSTDAALDKLFYNYEHFGDWALGIAAYNCGTGAMNKVIKSNEGKDFWYLAENGKLKQQTAQYVPKLLAIADIIENAEYYGAEDIAEAAALIGDEPADHFDYFTTNNMYSIEQIAKITETDASLLRTLNPALLRSCTPARYTYAFRLPAGTITEERTPEFIAKSLKDLGTPDDAIIYTVQEGDTLWGLSRKYKLSVQDLCDTNNIKENGVLRIKQQLIIPVLD